METAKKTGRKKQAWTADEILSAYMDRVAGESTAFHSTLQFCQTVGIPEAAFFEHFGSLDEIPETIWVRFLENAQSVIEKDPGFVNYTGRDKLLTFYFTLFEIFALNRGYILYTLKENREGLANLRQLRAFRKKFIEYVGTFVPAPTGETMQKWQKYREPVYAEGAWLQFLFLLKFWLDDRSKGFEKTDILIEKSVNTAATLLDTQPLENLFDLGKFLWKERR